MRRRHSLSLLLALPLLLLGTAAATADIWRLAHQMPPHSPEGRVWQRFADLAAGVVGDVAEADHRVDACYQLAMAQRTREIFKLPHRVAVGRALHLPTNRSVQGLATGDECDLRAMGSV